MTRSPGALGIRRAYDRQIVPNDREIVDYVTGTLRAEVADFIARETGTTIPLAAVVVRETAPSPEAVKAGLVAAEAVHLLAHYDYTPSPAEPASCGEIVAAAVTRLVDRVKEAVA